MQNVQVLLGQARPALRQASWYRTRLAKDFQPGLIIPNPKFQDTINSREPEFITIKAALPDDLWQEPTTGVILKKPNILRADFMEGYDPIDNWANSLVKDIQWRWNTDPSSFGYDFTIGTSSPATALTTHQFVGVPLRSAVDDGIAAIQVTKAIQNWMDHSDDMVPGLETNDPFQINEGLSAWIHPYGMFTDRAKTYSVIAFGSKYILEVRMNGSMVLNADLGYNASYITGNVPYTPKWVPVALFTTTDGGVSHTKPMQITIIPWGYDYISFLVSNVDDWNQTRKFSPRLTGSRLGKSFLYRISDSEGFNPPFDRKTGQYVKTYAAPVTIGTRAHNYSFGVGLAHVRYSKIVSELVLYPEFLPELKPYAAPTQKYEGFAGATSDPSSIQPTAIDQSFTNELGFPYNSTKDTEIVAKYELTASSDGMYTPELWLQTFSIPEDVWTPPWPVEDLSKFWTKIRFQRSTTPDTQKAEIRYRFGQDDDRFSKLFVDGGKPIRFTIKGVPMFDGNIDVNRPTVGAVIVAPPSIMDSPVVADIMGQHTAHDMWARLNDTEVDSYEFLDGLNMVKVIVALIKKAGFRDSDINVIDPNGYIASYDFESFQNANDWKNINPDATCGAVLRELLKNYWFKPIRVRWVDNQWLIYEAPTYTYVKNSPPAIQLAMVTPLGTSDTDRWSNHIYKVRGNFEIDNPEIDFNVLVARTIKEVGEGADGFEVTIPGNVLPTGDVNKYDYFPYRSVNDPTYPWFIGSVKVKTIQPPEITLATSLPELAKLARIYFERYAKRRPTGNCRCEWQEEIDVDEFVWVTGLDNHGNPCSYGAWRVDDVDVEISQDFPDRSNAHDFPDWVNSPFNNRDMSYTYDARLSLVFVGLADSKDVPMFEGIFPI